ncbi:hypothetical protein BH23GEM10_BH23GEM10_08600 [soil metagenome]
MQFGILLAGLAVIGGLLYRIRLTRTIGEVQPLLTDELVRQIEEDGRVDFDEPLDLEQIQEEEARFWEDQPWEDSDEW